MTTLWAASLPLQSALSAGSLRLEIELEVHVDSAQSLLWLRGPQDLSDDSAIDRKVRSLPAVERFTVLEERSLLAAGRRVPKGTLPAGPWQPLTHFLELQIQAAAFSGTFDQPLQLKLVRSSQEQNPTHLLTHITVLHDYANRAAEIRLKALIFSMNAEGDVVVAGQPLPSIPGQYLIKKDNVVHPVGSTLEPALDKSSLEVLLELAPDEFALFFDDGHYERIAKTHFQALSRSAVRQTLKEWRHDR
jgi:hypothetical protein